MSFKLPAMSPAERDEVYALTLAELREWGLEYKRYAQLAGVRAECISKRINRRQNVTQEAYLAALFVHGEAMKQTKDGEEGTL